MLASSSISEGNSSPSGLGGPSLIGSGAGGSGGGVGVTWDGSGVAGGAVVLGVRCDMLAFYHPWDQVQSGWVIQEEEGQLRVLYWLGVERNLIKLFPIVQLVCN